MKKYIVIYNAKQDKLSKEEDRRDKWIKVITVECVEVRLHYDGAIVDPKYSLGLEEYWNIAYWNIVFH